MELVQAKITLFFNNKIEIEYITDFEIVENFPEPQEIPVTWNTLVAIQNTYFNNLPNFFEIHKTRKGYVINKNYYYTMLNNSYLTIKEWKTPNLNMTIRIDYYLANKISIDDILNYKNAEMAIKYLIEKGLTIIHN